MKTVCAWCGKHLKGDPKSKEVSHGICRECAKAMKAEPNPTQRG